MARHLTNRDISRILSGYVHRKAESHISTCQSCRKRLEEAQKIITPAPGIRNLYPSAAVRTRLINTYRSMEKSTMQKKQSGSLLIPALAGSFIVIAAIASYFMLRPVQPSYTPMSITITDPASGVQGDRLSEKNVISTAINDRKVLSRPDDMNLYMGPETIIEIIEAREDENTGKENLALMLRQGSIHARFIHREDRTYSIDTPQGRIDSIGTEFIVEVKGASTEITLKEGTVRLVHRNGDTLRITGGSRWQISETSLTNMPHDIKNEQRILDSIHGEQLKPVDMKADELEKNRENMKTDASGIRKKTSDISGKAEEKQNKVSDIKDRPGAGDRLNRDSTKENRDELDRMRREHKKESNQELKKMKRELQGPGPIGPSRGKGPDF